MPVQKSKIGIIGLGMVGHTLRKWFTDIKLYQQGKDLFCFDIDPAKKCRDDVNQADIIFVCLPTPSQANGRCDISLIKKTVASLADGKTIVIKSTVEPGTVEGLQKKHPRKLFIFNPEFLTESQAWSDFIDPDRQIVAPTNQSKSAAGEVLGLLPDAFFVSPGHKDKNCYGKVRLNASEAEIGKYAGNVFGYIKVIFGNILADVAHGLESKFKKEDVTSAVSYENIKEMLGHDYRIGMSWLNVNHGSYCGAGGFCLPKDMDAFIYFLGGLIKSLKKKKGTSPELIRSLQYGYKILTAIKDYNVQLLKWQGLNLKQVSNHTHKLALKPKKIRQ